MDNPAKKLLDLLETWSGPGHAAPETYRNGGTPTEPRFWGLQNRAVGLLVEIERTLDEMKVFDPEFDDEVHRKELLAAYQAVYGYDPVWRSAVRGGSSSAHPVLRDTTGLRRIVGLIRLHHRTLGFESVDRDALVSTIEEVLQEAEKADYLAAEVRAHIVTLLTRVLVLLRDGLATDGQIQSAVLEASGTLVNVSQVAEMPEPKRSFWRRKADQVGVGVLTNLATDGARTGIGAGIRVAQAVIESLPDS